MRNFEELLEKCILERLESSDCGISRLRVSVCKSHFEDYCFNDIQFPERIAQMPFLICIFGEQREPHPVWFGRNRQDASAIALV